MKKIILISLLSLFSCIKKERVVYYEECVKSHKEPKWGVYYDVFSRKMCQGYHPTTVCDESKKTKHVEYYYEFK